MTVMVIFLVLFMVLFAWWSSCCLFMVLLMVLFIAPEALDLDDQLYIFLTCGQATIVEIAFRIWSAKANTRKCSNEDLNYPVR